MQNFNYVVGCPRTKKGGCFDPAFEPERAVEILKNNGYSLDAVFLTHNHYDHMDGLSFLIKKCDPTVYIHLLDQGPVKRMTKKIKNVSDNDVISLGEVKIRVLHTPGHTPGSVCYLIHDQVLVSGDTLFQGNCGRCDLAGGSAKKMFQSFQTKIKTLNPDIKVYPGHDYGSKPNSTIDYELKNNPALMAKTYEDFIKIP